VSALSSRRRRLLVAGLRRLGFTMRHDALGRWEGLRGRALAVTYHGDELTPTLYGYVPDEPILAPLCAKLGVKLALGRPRVAVAAPEPPVVSPVQEPPRRAAGGPVSMAAAPVGGRAQLRLW